MAFEHATNNLSMALVFTFFRWWANGNIICNEHSSLGNDAKSQYWGDQFNAPLRDLLEDTCQSRVVSLVVICCAGYLKGSCKCFFSF